MGKEIQLKAQYQTNLNNLKPGGIQILALLLPKPQKDIIFDNLYYKSSKEVEARHVHKSICFNKVDSVNQNICTLKAIK